MKKLLVLVFAALVLAGCDRTEPTSSAAEKITIAQFGHVFLYLPLYVAKDKGFFEQGGLDVTLVSTGGDEKTFAAVAGGSAQFGVADPTFVAIARERGQGGKVVASVVNGATFWGITYNDDIQPTTTPEGLAGLKIATYTAPSTNYTIMKKLLQNEGTPVDAEIVQGAFGSLIAMLKAGQADIAMELEPVTSIAVADGAHVVYSMVNAFGDFAFTGLTTTDQYIVDHPETVQATVTALNKAMRFIYSDFEGALQVAIQEFPDVEEPILRSALKRLVDERTIPESVVLTQEAWDKAIALRQEVGDLKGDAPFAENVEMTFAEKATD
jgi:NitT/TauT family transport system substrate-binding protein